MTVFACFTYLLTCGKHCVLEHSCPQCSSKNAHSLVVSPLVYRPVPAATAPECRALARPRHPPLARSTPLIITPPLVIPSSFERSRVGDVRVALIRMRGRSIQVRGRSLQVRGRSIQVRRHERLERGGDHERSGRRCVHSLRWVAHLCTEGVGMLRLGLGLG